jgi:transposase
MKKYTNKLFNLQGVLTGRMEFDDEREEVILSCRGAKRIAKCPACGCGTKRVHQVSRRKIKHGVLDHKIINLDLKVRRFKCSHCQHVFTEKFPGIDRRRTSANFRRQLLDWLRRNSFRYIGQKFNISPATLTRCVLEINGDIEVDWSQANVTKLGIDEHSFRGKRLVITVTDLSNKKLLAILKGDSQACLEDFLRQIPRKYRANINEVVTDLRESYRAVINRYLPEASHTADRYHVETLARRALDDIRQVVQEMGQGRKVNMKKLLWANKHALNDQELRKLELIFKRYEKYPVLKQAWVIKEKIIQMYQTRDKEESKEKFEHIIMLLETPEYSRYLETLRRTMKRWKGPILNYFENRTTNGFTEGCHTKIKMIKRISFGFRNIDNYIAKVTLAFLPLSFIISYHTI